METTAISLNKFKSFISIFILLFTLLSFNACNKETIKIFVSTEGNDQSGKGTIDLPFASLERARMEIENLNKIDNKEVSYEVQLREGTYYIKNTFKLTEKDSGGRNFPIIYTAYKNEKVEINGGINIPLNEATSVKNPEILKRFSSDVQSKIKQINLKELNITNYGNLRPIGFSRPFGPTWAELFVNGNPMSLAKWPNDKTIPMGKIIDPGSIPRNGDMSNRGGSFTYKTDRPNSWKSHDDIWISGYFKYGYAEDAVKLAEIDLKNKVFKTVQPTLYGFGSGQVFNTWFVYNVLEEVDVPGEYYLDRKSGILYFYPSEKIESLEISMLETPMISLVKASNIQFKNINFKCSRGMGVYMEETENNIVQGCTFSNLGIVGVTMGKGVKAFGSLTHEMSGEPASEVIGSYLQHIYKKPMYNRLAGKNNGVIDCTIYNTGAGGVHLGGGNRVTLEPGNNYVENTSIHDFNRIEKSYRAGINISGVGNRISNCEIYNAPSMAILLHGNNHLIEYNEIYDVCTEVDDQGAIYYGRDPSERGTKVKYNYIHNISDFHRTTAVYHDDGACGMEVFGNIFYKAGSLPVLIGGGMDNPYTNNIFIDFNLAVHVDNRLQNWNKVALDKDGIFEERLNLVNFKKPPYSAAYPNLAKYWEDNPSLPKRNTFSKNIFYKVKRVHNGNKKWLPFLDDNWVTNENPGFINEDEKNFNLKKNARAFEKIPGFEKIPFDKIGVQNKERSN